MKGLVLSILFILMTMAQGHAASPQYDADTICIPVYLHTQNGKQLDLSLELAVSPGATRQGLMYREFLPPLGGMLFVFNPPQGVSMWMKNTLIPLDMLFISSDNKILNIHHNAIPHDLTPLPSMGLAQYVIELRGGAAKAYGINAGDRISLPQGIFNFQ